ncbi:MAG: hypothetical protein AAFX58_08085 [Pseudomonadota bacterium]
MTPLRITLALALLALSPNLQAQTPAGYADNRPERGMTMKAVERSFGAPETRRSAVGDPPITRWVYPGFTVYFEYDRVIHAVATRRG